MKKFKYILSLLLAIVIIVPTITQAYFTSSQEAIRLDNESVLYLISYDFGMKKHAMTLPILTDRATTDVPEKENFVFYKINEEFGDTIFTEGVTTGIVLSSAEIIDGKYYIPAGKAERFTLMVVLSDVDAMEDGEKLDLSMQVSRLPFSIKSENIELKARLNDSELKHYVTPKEKFRFK